jgi:ATP synthase protein I
VRFGPLLNVESPLYRIIIVQVVLTVSAAGTSLIFGLASAYSTLLGGLVCVVPGFVAARMVVAHGVRQESLMTSGLGSIIRSELTRLVLSVVLFIATFTLVKTLDLLFFFSTFIGLQAVYLLVPVAEANRLRRRMTIKMAARQRYQGPRTDYGRRYPHI